MDHEAGALLGVPEYAELLRFGVAEEIRVCFCVVVWWDVDGEGWLSTRSQETAWLYHCKIALFDQFKPSCHSCGFGFEMLC